MINGVAGTPDFSNFIGLKTVASILTSLLLFLTVQPLLLNCFSAEGGQQRMEQGCCSTGRCHNKQPVNRSGNRDSEHANGCNPFAGCSGCQYVAAARVNYTTQLQSQSDVYPLPFSEDEHRGFGGQCFQPPEAGPRYV